MSLRQGFVANPYADLLTV